MYCRENSHEMYDLWEISHIPIRCGKFPKIISATFIAESSHSQRIREQ
jgi:hypothetical protein